MRLLLLLPYALDTAPSQRYRIEQWRPWLEREGVRCEAATLLTLPEQRLLHSRANPLRKAAMMSARMLLRLAQLPSVRDYDAVWLHRAAWPAGPPWVEQILSRMRVPLVFEFDDAIWMTHTSEANRRWQFLKFSRKTSLICRMAAHVVVGNEYLAAYARQFTPHVTVIPTTVDTEVYTPRTAYETAGPVRIGWSGSITTQPHLRMLDRVFSRIAAEENVELRVIGVPEHRVEGVSTRAVEWRPERQVAELSAFDIGVMPLPDEEWARGKCACKALEYMAVGVPTVTSPVGVNGDIIRDGENGFLARDDDEWADRLLRLVRDARLRERVGRAGRVTVEQGYSAASRAPRVAELLRRVCGWEAASAPLDRPVSADAAP